MRPSPLLTASILLAQACGGPEAGPTDAAEGWEQEYGRTPSMYEGDASQEVAPPLGKADGAGRLGPHVRWDKGAARVWEVHRAWTDVEPEPGLAWEEDSGLNWEEKYSAWVASLPELDTEHGRTFELVTPYKRLPAPVLECAEVAIFLRTAFASWHGLPFFLEARDAGKPIYIGHFGFKRHDGTNFGRSPDFSRRYLDHRDTWTRGDDWPSDAKLRGRGLYGGGDDHDFLPPVGAEAARAGAYFDEIFLNKRTGHFMLLALSWFGSMHLADGSNMFHVVPKAIRPGDTLLQRWQRRGIGHTIPVMRVTKIEAERIEVAVAAGSMPRRQPKWQDGGAAARHFSAGTAGGPGENSDGDAYAALGGGLRRWRSALAVGASSDTARYRNTFLPSETELWIDSDSLEALAARTETFKGLMKRLTVEERVALAKERVEAAREHLRDYPASCSARNNREEAFDELEELLVAEFGHEPDAVQAAHRTFEDHVFAQLEYAKSKTCCWNRSTAAMYEIIMEFNRRLVADVTTGQCRSPLVFKARDAGGANDGYAQFRAFAEEIGRGDAWVAWTADEPCPQAAGLSEDVLKVPEAPTWCALEGHRTAGAGAAEGPPDDGEDSGEDSGEGEGEGEGEG